MAARNKLTRSLFGFLLISVISALVTPAPMARADEGYGYPTDPFQIIPETSAYGAFSSFDYQKKHTGVDVAGSAGTPVLAVCDGKIVWWDDWPWQGEGSWVNTLWLDCGNGDYFGYSHLSDQDPHASVGQEVQKGDRIGVLGDIDPDNPLQSGYGTGDHLHFMKTRTDPTSVTKENLRWIWVDPMDGIGKAPAQPRAQSTELTIVDQTSEGLAAFNRTSCTKKSSFDWIVWHQIVNSNGEGYWDGVRLAKYFKSGRGWDAPGYTFLLDSEAQSNGTVKIWQLWPIDCITYGVGENYNVSGIHIAYVDVPAEAPPNAAQLKTLELLTLQLMAEYDISPDHVVSHKETALRERGGLEWTDAMMDQWYRMNDNRGVPHAWRPEAREIPAACDDLSDSGCVSILNNPHGDPVGLDMDLERQKLGSSSLPDSSAASSQPITTTIEKTVVAEIRDATGGFIVAAHLDSGARVVATGNNTAQALTEHMQELGDGGYCVMNGSFWEADKRLTFAYVKEGELITKGEKLPGSYATRAVYFNGMEARVSSTIDMNATGDMIVGLVPDETDLDARGTTLVGVNGSNVYFVVIKGTVAQGVAELTSRGVHKDNIVQLDGGGSSQLLCTGKTLIASERTIPQGVGIIVPPESIAAPTVSYEPRPAQGDPIRDETQPLAPMWMSSPTVWYWRENIYDWAKEWDVNPNAIAAIMQIESCGLPTAVSRSDARGLLQVMPRYHLDPGETADMLFDPELNADKGMKFYNSCLSKSGGDPRKAAACYNGGYVVLTTTEAYWPSETQKYAKLFQMAFDGFEASESSETLTTQVGGGSRPGGLCAQAAEWQLAHPRKTESIGGVPQDAILQSERTASIQPGIDYDGKRIVLDFPPFVYVFVLYGISGLIALFVDYRYYRVYRKRKSERTYKVYNVKYAGRKLAKAITVIVLVLWFPLNFGKIFTAIDHGVLPYTNTSFAVRQWFEEKGQPLDQVDEVVTWVSENAPLPDAWKEKTEAVTTTVKRARDTKDAFVNVFTWLGDDPLLTPFFRWASNAFQEQIVPDDVLMHGDWTVQYYPFTQAIVPEGTVVKLRSVVMENGTTNVWGLHGEMCYSCAGVKSWLGTDLVLDPNVYVQSPVVGVVEQVILDGTQDIGGNSIWITATDVRFALIGVRKEDALKWQVGQQVALGQQIARPNGPHLHVVMEVRNKDGSWGDYPVALLLDATDSTYSWFSSVPPYYDAYVPTEPKVAENSQYILRR